MRDTKIYLSIIRKSGQDIPILVHFKKKKREDDYITSLA